MTRQHLSRRTVLAIVGLFAPIALISACSSTTSDTTNDTAAPATTDAPADIDVRGETITIYSGRNEALMSALFTASRTTPFFS